MQQVIGPGLVKFSEVWCVFLSAATGRSSQQATNPVAEGGIGKRVGVEDVPVELTDHSQVDILDPRYKPANLRGWGLAT